MPEWLPVVRRELARYREQTGHDVVELQELYPQMLPVLEAAFPENDNPDARLRRTLQQLRDSDEVEFLDYEGTYRILSLSDDHAPPLGESAPDASTASPADSDATDLADVQYTAAEYETTVGARSMPRAFRDAILDSYATPARSRASTTTACSTSPTSCRGATTPTDGPTRATSCRSRRPTTRRSTRDCSPSTPTAGSTPGPTSRPTATTSGGPSSTATARASTRSTARR